MLGDLNPRPIDYEVASSGYLAITLRILSRELRPALGHYPPDSAGGPRGPYRTAPQHYGFTDEELDFIINYDIKYRMGDELFEEEG